MTKIKVHGAKTRYNEHEDKNSKSEPAKHLKENPTHKFTWTIISKAPENFRKCRVLEAYFIKTTCPTLNEQLHFFNTFEVASIRYNL